jgi:Protein of unknown function (DUF1579)
MRGRDFVSGHDDATFRRARHLTGTRNLMKLLLTALFVLTTALGLRSALAAEPTQSSAPQTTADDPFRPGPQHARLQKLAGTWDAVLVRTDEHGALQRTRGTLTTTAHTGFHTVDTFRGEFMGGPYLGHGVNGYRSARKQYFRSGRTR